MEKKQYIRTLIIFLTIIKFSENANITSLPVSSTSKPIDVPVVSKPSNKSIDLTHMGREHVTEEAPKILKPDLSTTDKPNIPNSTEGPKTTTKKTEEKIPVISNTEKSNIESRISNETNKDQILNKTSSSLPDSSSTTSHPSTESQASPSTPKPVVKKPLVTVHDDEMPKVEPLFKDSGISSNPMNIDPVLSKKNHERTNYVVPIVAVILSVPLVAGLISIFYKRGKDWWLHRNYRRMDYLIEGMYNG